MSLLAEVASRCTVGGIVADLVQMVNSRTGMTSVVSYKGRSKLDFASATLC